MEVRSSPIDQSASALVYRGPEAIHNDLIALKIKLDNIQTWLKEISKNIEKDKTFEGRLPTRNLPPIREKKEKIDQLVTECAEILGKMGDAELVSFQRVKQEPCTTISLEDEEARPQRKRIRYKAELFECTQFLVEHFQRLSEGKTKTRWRCFD